MIYKQLYVHVHLRAEDIDHIRLLLDLEWRRIHDESPFAFDDRTSWAGQIAALREQFIFLQDSNLAPATAGDKQ